MHNLWHAGLDRLNRLPPEAAAVELLTCCASAAWAQAVAGGRPYADRADLLAAADAASAALRWQDVADALAAHPRIGERATGAGREATWSRREQAGTEEADTAIQAALADGNRAYEERFGHVFLIRAAGRSGAEMLAALQQRLRNDDDTERAVVAEELRQIARLRLDHLLGTANPAPIDTQAVHR